MRGWQSVAKVKKSLDLCAAVYLRMSTDHQRYSLGNQIQALAAHAIQHGLTVVDAFADEGKSGLDVRGRPALRQLLACIEDGTRGFGVLLVLDISRWGRFQNVDESAYLEYLCLLGGVRVVYTAEPFENDASPVSAMLKGMKRVMAGEFSRELSRRVSASLQRMAAQGHHVGGPAVYGMRRAAVDDQGIVRKLLTRGEHKSFLSDHVELVPGPPAELRVVRRIFREFVRDKGREGAICERLNAAGIPGPEGARWKIHSVRRMLDNPVYAGKAVYNRVTVCFRAPMKRNPKRMWIERIAKYPPIVSPRLYGAVQAILKARVTRPEDESILQPLRDLFARTGRLSARLINKSPGVPNSWVIQTHFGTLLRAYELAGLPACRDFHYLDINRQLGGVRGSHVDGVRHVLEAAGHDVEVIDEDQTLRVDDSWGCTVKIARALPKAPYGRRWRLQFHPPPTAEICVFIRMDIRGHEVVDYYVLPRSVMGGRMTVLGDRNNPATDLFRCERLDEVATLALKVLSGEIPAPAFRIGRTLFTRANARRRIKLDGG